MMRHHPFTGSTEQAILVQSANSVARLGDGRFELLRVGTNDKLMLRVERWGRLICPLDNLLTW